MIMTMINTTINTNEMESTDVVILSVPYEKTTSSGKGTINGPREIIKCLDYMLEFFDRKFQLNINEIIKTINTTEINFHHLIENHFHKIKLKARYKIKVMIHLLIKINDHKPLV